MKETLGEYIHALRIGKCMTLTKLAAALDLDQSTLSKIENNKRSLAFETLPKVANVFSLNLRELEKEYYSEKIAELIYLENDANDLLILAQEKAKYFRSRKIKQGDLDL